jgi:UDP-GlcNAc:undecaprenyl-phosphate GlcNAc-1-phosphate transferase
MSFLSPRFHSGQPWGVLIGAATVCALGIADDVWQLDAVTKLAGQAIAAGLMAWKGVQIVSLPVVGVTIFSPGVLVLLTVFAVLVTINAVNFVDGLDGLAAGVAGISALAMFAYSYQLSVHVGIERAQTPALLSVVLAGACAGFLPHNFAPARLFMGDSGSMLIGLVLAAVTASVTGQVGYAGLAGRGALPFLIPLLVPVAVLAVPFVDLVLAVVRRASAGRSPFAPDKRHLHHRLLEIGHSVRRAVLLMYFWAAVLAFGGVALSLSRGPLFVAAIVGVLMVVALVATAMPRLRAHRP